MPTQARKWIVVLGMHRTGTSALTGLLTLAGADAGSGLLPANPSNPKGFFESGRVVDLNNRILKALGSSWEDTRPLQANWWLDPSMSDFEAEISELLVTDFAAISLPIIKDPRLCRTLPLWLVALTKAGITPHFVICVRQPSAVAISERSMKGLPLLKTLMLYLDYTLSAERYTRGYPRVGITYAGLLADWRSALTSISKELAIGFPRQLPEMVDEADAFITASLNRSDQQNSGYYAECGTLAKFADQVAPAMVDLDILAMEPLQGQFVRYQELLAPWLLTLELAVSTARQHPYSDCGDLHAHKLKATLVGIDTVTGNVDAAEAVAIGFSGGGEHCFSFPLPPKHRSRYRLALGHKPAVVTLKSARLVSGGEVLWQSGNTTGLAIARTEGAVSLPDKDVGAPARWLVLSANHYFEFDLDKSARINEMESFMLVDLRIEDPGVANGPLLARYNHLKAESQRLRENDATEREQLADRTHAELARAEAQLELLKDMLLSARAAV